MLQGIRDDMRKAVERLEHDEPEKYADSQRSLPAAAGDSPRPVPAVYAASR